MKIYIVAGEPSGDLHASNLINAIKSQSPNIQFKGMGGDRFREATGIKPTVHIRETNIMGFTEVIKHLPRIRRIMKAIQADILDFQPDVVVLIDYPGFNLRIAKFAHQAGIKVVYYISPQVWAWKKGRIRGLKKYVDRMLCILPFEKEFYRKEGWEVEYVGHPLIDHIFEYKFDKKILENQQLTAPIIALLPGSRRQEIATMLPIMLQVSKHFPEYRFVIAGAPTQSSEYYEQILAENDIKLPVIIGKTYDLLQQASAALVTSGTATLETALLNVPQIVCYKGGAISYWIAKRLVNIKYISLVNLILDRPAVKECIQSEMNTKTLTHELHELLYNSVKRERIFSDYQALRQLLQGGASQKAAQAILSLVE
jgi:lipid-A-disaccharide synthase